MGIVAAKPANKGTQATAESVERRPARYHSGCTVTSTVAASLVPRVACSSQTATGRRGLGARRLFRRRARNAADQVDGAPVCGWA